MNRNRSLVPLAIILVVGVVYSLWQVYLYVTGDEVSVRGALSIPMLVFSILWAAAMPTRWARGGRNPLYHLPFIPIFYWFWFLFYGVSRTAFLGTVITFAVWLLVIWLSLRHRVEFSSSFHHQE